MKRRLFASDDVATNAVARMTPRFGDASRAIVTRGDPLQPKMVRHTMPQCGRASTIDCVGPVDEVRQWKLHTFRVAISHHRIAHNSCRRNGLRVETASQKDDEVIDRASFCG
jgi:hypothetical protein